jgi:hypothetical protein
MMEIHKLEHGRVHSLQLVSSEGGWEPAEPKQNTLVSLRLSDDLGWILAQEAQHEERIWLVEAADGAGRKRLEAIELHPGAPRLCWVSAKIQGENGLRQIVVQTHEFSAEYRWAEPLELGIDDKIVEDVRRRYLPRKHTPASAEEIIAWLDDQIVVVPDASTPKVLISAGPRTRARRRLEAFRLHGKRIAVDVQRRDDGTLRVEKVVGSKEAARPEDLRPIFLIHTPARFCDITMAARFEGQGRTELEQIVKSADTYLGLWSDYNRLELSNILERARDFGWVYYDGFSRKANGDLAFKVSGNPRYIEELMVKIRDRRVNEQYDALTELPKFLSSSDFEELDDVKVRELVRYRWPISFSGELVEVDDHAGWIVLRPRDADLVRLPESSGYLMPSLRGDFKRLRRRWEAEGRIRSGECEMPQLGLILEGRAGIEGRVARHKPMSPRVRELFGGEPTSKQQEAIGVALNTPDIALIQGPPGTGKTRTLAALQARIAELDEESFDVDDQILLTSYQHDAVENAAERTKVLGLPAIKRDRRGGDDDLDTVEKWRQHQQHRLEGHLSDVRPLDALERRLQSAVVSFRCQPPTPESSMAVVDEVLEVSSGEDLLSDALRDELLEMRGRLERQHRSRGGHDVSQEVLRQTAWRLRGTPESFFDDGPLNAIRVRRRFADADLLEDEERELLDRAADWLSSESPPFLDDLARLRNRLLDRALSDNTPVGLRLGDSKLDALLTQVLEELEARRMESLSGVDSVLMRYFEDLRGDPTGVRRTLEDYTAVLAVTCQHSAPDALSRYKRVDFEPLGRLDPALTFDTVVVDEAARSNPLDLFIPMSLASRRIVLVGDHRQLPHLLDREIERELDKSVDNSTEEMLGKSLFERLFLYLRDLEGSDGIKRTVTLDRQFRMHPRLGQFVSQTFYEHHSEQRISPGREASEFGHTVPGLEDKVAGWVDVPFERGAEKSGQSKSRPVEADEIARRLRSALEQNPDLTFGVISFYRAQVDAIKRACAKQDLGTMKDGHFRLHKRWARTQNDEGEVETRLQIGTVDSFQGKEFDVVFVSMTRSNRLDDGSARLLRKKYGHLTLENRLCVAMSRQKSLLVVFGDPAMLQTESAPEAIRGLVEFRKLCEGGDGAVL